LQQKYLIPLKKIYPYLSLILFIFLASIFWEYIKIPYNYSKDIPGQDYLKNFHNPWNDSLRFVVFIFLPLSAFLISKLFLMKLKLLDFFIFFFKDDKANLNEHSLVKNNLNLYLFLLIFIILLEFLSLDFKNFVYNIDLFHEGLWLTPSSNSILNNELWQSSYVARGLFGNFHNYFIWKITDMNSIGISRFITLFFMMLNKILLVLITKSLTQKTFLDQNQKNLFFIILSFLLIGLISYDIGASTFYYRLFGLLFFTICLLSFLEHFRIFSVSFFFMGLLSSASFFWFIDIGIFINFTIFLLIIFFAFKKFYSKIFFLLLIIIFGWTLCLLILPEQEFSAFYLNVFNIVSTIEYIQGLIYPTPFLSKDVRSTKALLLILITGVFVINSLFQKNNETSYETKLSLFFLFIISCINFKIALSRSDTGHIKSGLSFIHIPLFYFVLTYIFYWYNKLNLKLNSKLPDGSIQVVFLIFFVLITFNKKQSINIKNVFNSLNNFNYLVKEKDDAYLDDDYKEFIDFYKKISLNEKCVQIFTNENAVPYLLKKPTCSKYFSVYISSPRNLQNDFINDLSLKKPTYILYDSMVDIYDDPKLRLGIVNQYILNNYIKFKKINKWTIYKIN